MIDGEIAANAKTSATALTDRLALLREEYQTGRAQMEALDQRQQQLRDTMLRISGAIQVLEEVLAQAVVASPPEGRANGHEPVLAGGPPGSP